MQSLTSKMKAYAASLLSFVVLDAAWLVLVATPMFKRDVGPLLREQPDLVAAVAFYLIYAFGLCALAVVPAIERRAIMAAAGAGATVGLTAYATFDLTALAILKGWTIELALIDMAWGTVVSAIAACVGASVGMRSAGTSP